MGICAELTLELKGLHLQRKTLSWSLHVCYCCLEAHGPEEGFVMDAQAAPHTTSVTQLDTLGQSVRILIALALYLFTLTLHLFPVVYGWWHHAFNITSCYVEFTHKNFMVSCLFFFFLIKKVRTLRLEGFFILFFWFFFPTDSFTSCVGHKEEETKWCVQVERLCCPQENYGH